MEPIPEDLLTRLQEPDERALVFNPIGLGGRMPPEQAARFQAASARLAEDVPDGIRDYWERVRLLHQHGVLEYQFFSAAADLALLALEGALRRRFVDFYDGRIPVIRRRGPTKGAQAVLWDLAVPGEPRRPLPTSLTPFLAWARRVKLLPRRRSRRVDQSLVKLRNWAAHPDDYSLDYPPSVARGLCQIAQYINMLWGHPSPDGRMFKTRAHRRPRVVGLSPTADASVAGASLAFPLPSFLRHLETSATDQASARGARHRDFLDHLGDGVWVGALFDVAVRATSEDVGGDHRADESRDDDDLCLGRYSFDLGQRVESGPARHREVEQDHVRLESVRLLDRPFAVFCLADDTEAWPHPHGHAEQYPHRLDVVADQDADRAVRSGFSLSIPLSHPMRYPGSAARC